MKVEVEAPPASNATLPEHERKDREAWAAMLAKQEKPPKDLYDRELSVFSAAMRHKLLANAGKGRWEGVSLETALEKLRREVDELEEAVKKGDFIEILLEAADVANWSLIVFFVAVRGMR